MPPPAAGSVTTLHHPTQPSIFFSTDRVLLDIPFIHHQLSTQHYWSFGITLEILTAAINNSLCIGIYDSSSPSSSSTGSGSVDPSPTAKPKQIGFARWVTDYACFGCLSDVFLIPSYQRRGLGKWIVEEAVNMQEVRWCRRLVLTTRDPEFYERLNGEKWRRVTAPSEAATENVVRDGKGKGENGTTNLVPVEMTVMAITRDNKVLYASG